MASASSLNALFAFRVLDGAVHLPAITFLMVMGNRLGGDDRRGAALGSVAMAIMAGVAIGSPLGGWLVTRGPQILYLTGAAILVVAAAVVAFLPSVDGVSRRQRSRYEWQGSRLVTWIPLAYAFLDRFSVGIFVSTFTLYLANVAGLSPSRRGLLVALFMVPFAALCYPAGRLADRVGWLRPLLVGNILYGITFASYGLIPVGWLPVAMIASGVFSALMFAPSLVMISDLARQGAGEGLFGAFQVAGSLGFLFGPVVGGVLVSVTRSPAGVPAYAAIFAGVGAFAAVLAGTTWATCRGVVSGFPAPSSGHTASASS
jgi:MFS family permease